MNCIIGKQKMNFILTGRIDSTNSAKVEEYFMKHLHDNPDKEISIDATELSYISSAGLRALLKLKKKSGKDIVISNVSDEIHDILAVTGFLEMFEVNRKPKAIFLDKSEVLIRSLNGKFYKQPNDTMVKVYNKGISLDQIKRERDLSKKAMIIGVPTPIPYEICTVGDCYGLIFEASNTTSLAQLMTNDSGLIDYCAKQFAHFLKELHTIEVTSDVFPNIKDKYREWLELAKNWISPQDKDSINALLNGIPDSKGYLHGSITLSNVILHNDELMVLDMSSSSYGHPIFDLQNIYASLVEMEKERPMYCSSVLGVSADSCLKFWNSFFREYMNGEDEEKINAMQLLLKRYYILNHKLLSVLEDK